MATTAGVKKSGKTFKNKTLEKETTEVFLHRMAFILGLPSFRSIFKPYYKSGVLTLMR